VEHTRFEIDSSPEAQEVESLKDRVDTFNMDETRIYDFKEVAIFLRDPPGQMIAGLYAYTWGGCLDIKLVWVREDCRGRGLGSSLMRAAEREAIARGCHIAMVATHSFQAPDFYKQLGYEEIGVLDGYPIHHKKYFLRKPLPGRAGSPTRPG
jgi:ribosomal protein S18 acetylase RimI-like enzyme